MDKTNTIAPPASAATPESKTPAAKAPAAPNAAPKRSREELVKEGWGKDELKMAEDAGEIEPEAKEAPAPAPKAAKKDGAAAADAPEKGDEPEPKSEVKTPPKPAGGIPDMTLTPEQEAQFVKLFPEGSPQHGLYFYGKKERRERQRLAQQVEELKRALADKNSVKDPAVPGAEGEELDLDKPLSIRALQEYERKQEEKRQKLAHEQRQRFAAITTAQKEQETYARTVFPDFEPTVELAKDVINNFETLFPEKWQQDEVLELIGSLQKAALEADKYGIEDNNAARIAHKIGRMHPRYGKAPAPAGDEPQPDQPGNTGPKNPKAPSSQTLATLKRIETNTQRRPSSASVPSGDGGRALVPGEVTAEMLDAMTSKDREAFRDAHPTEYAELMRG